MVEIKGGVVCWHATALHPTNRPDRRLRQNNVARAQRPREGHGDVGGVVDLPADAPPTTRDEPSASLGRHGLEVLIEDDKVVAVVVG